MSQKLSDTILAFNGSDARTVLQGQTTRNFAKAATRSVLEGAFCDLKGRVIADFCAVILRDDHILLRTDSEVAVALTDHLKKYLMFSKTQITASDLSVWACKTSDTAGHSITEPLITLAKPGGFAEVWSKSEPKMAEAVDVNSFHANRLQWGEARLFKPTIGKYLPQDLNYDVEGRVDFDKGCYTGQEIIARLHYRGEPKRRLRLLSVSEGIQPALGEKVVNSDGKTLGSVVDYAVSNGQCLCLCELVLDIDQQAAHICESVASASELQYF